MKQPFVRRKMKGKVTNVLVTGGGGFIGSHFALSLIDRKGFNITLVDDLSRGSIDTVLRLQARAAVFFCTAPSVIGDAGAFARARSRSVSSH